MTYKNLDALGQLLGCYFHQDWFEEFDSDMSALQSIVESEPKERLWAGVAEIDALLTALLPEGELKIILTDEVGCYFEPSSQGITYAEWLKRVREKFAQ
jgi:hypothetical protein